MNQRIKSIDFLRGLAIFFVLGYHCPPLKHLFYWGWTGVDLFFVLSGFLVSGLLFKEYKKTGAIKGATFLIRRGLKIYPAFYLYILVMLLITFLNSYLFKNPLHLTIPQLLAEVFFVQNYFQGLHAQTWSLGIEEHFYLFLTLLVFLLVKFKKLKWPVMLAVYLSLLIVAFLSRLVRYEPSAFDDLVNSFPTHLRVDALFFGSLLAFLYHFKRDTLDRMVKHRVIMTVLGLGLVSIQFFYSKHDYFMNVYGMPLLYIGYGLLLIQTVTYAKFDSLFVSYLRLPYNLICWVGFYSYSIYLWHLGVPQLLIVVLETLLHVEIPVTLYVMIYVFASVLLGAFFSRLIEQPVLKLRDRYFPKSGINPIA